MYHTLLLSARFQTSMSLPPSVFLRQVLQERHIQLIYYNFALATAVDAELGSTAGIECRV